MTETPYIEPPWGEATVEALNAYQRAGVFHPFTCPNRSDAGHGRSLGDLGTLVARADGWLCPSCGYRQLWAHEFMATPEARTPQWGGAL